MQVYTMLYSPTGRFLIFYKRKKGYFYHGKNNSGSVYKNGHNIPYGADNYALPGGKMESGDIKTEGQKEFVEECGALISFSDKLITIDKQPYKILHDATHQFASGKYGYSAYYVQVSDDDLSEIFTILADTNFPVAELAVKDIQDETITSYDKIHIKYPYCPLDNELDYVWVWNVFEDQDAINQLNKQPTDWFYTIIMFLKGKLS